MQENVLKVNLLLKAEIFLNRGEIVAEFSTGATMIYLNSLFLV